VSGRKLPLLAELARYRVAHAAGSGSPLPVNLTVSVTYSCPSRCATCDIWQKKVDDLSVDEYAKTFRTLGKAPIWVTVSGGDQFLRGDLDEILRLVRAEIEPKIINIPMNGVVTARIFDLLPKIAANTVGASLVLNLSVDEIGVAHDELRGAPGNFEKLREVAALIRDLGKTYDHLVLGVHTVISRFNWARVGEIEREARAIFQPDSYIAEVAEERVELGTTGKSITPTPAQYREATAHLVASIRARRSRHLVGRLVESFRLEYYDLAGRVLEERRQIVDCYAGWASAQLAPDGDVWGCCVRAEPLGNVRDHGYDFGVVWRGARADAFRASVKAKECACPLANASYTNMLLDAPSLARVTTNLVDVRGARR
jgi:MoaA/NifB/PqqE/SkfB family radical SAM enzyme